MSLFKLLLATSLVALAPAEVITLTTGNRSINSPQPAFSREKITLEKGETATATYVSNNAHVDVTIGGKLIRLDANDSDQANLPVIAGPAVIQIANFETINASLATFTVKRLDDPVPSPPNIVVIPDDGSGNHQVTLESSTDMITWTTTSPGFFNSSNAARFFRVRIKK